MRILAMMKNLFGKALGIEQPWYIENVNFDEAEKRLDIDINFKRGSQFFYENKQEGISGQFPAYDTVKKRWRHLNFFEHECYLHCRVPRVKPADGKIRHIQTPWEGISPGFTLLFEALLLTLSKEMPVNAVSRLSNVDDNKIWRMLDHYVNTARKEEDFSHVSQVGLDETSKKKRHDYVTLFVDLKKRKTMYVTEGKDHSTIKRFCNDLLQHNGDPLNITDVSCDMSPAFIKGSAENFTNAQVTFDKFHLVKIINEAVGKVRKLEAVENEVLKGTKNLFQKNRKNMTEKQLKYLQEKLDLKGLNLKTVRAFHLREAFQNIYTAETEKEFISLLKKWYGWAIRSRLEPMRKAAKTIKNHWDGVVRWFTSKISNGILEGLNSLIQSAKSKARGFSTNKNFKIAIYLITADLDFKKVNKFYKPLTGITHLK